MPGTVRVINAIQTGAFEDDDLAMLLALAAFICGSNVSPDELFLDVDRQLENPQVPSPWRAAYPAYIVHAVEVRGQTRILDIMDPGVYNEILCAALHPALHGIYSIDGGSGAVPAAVAGGPLVPAELELAALIARVAEETLQELSAWTITNAAYIVYAVEVRRQMGILDGIDPGVYTRILCAALYPALYWVSSLESSSGAILADVAGGPADPAERENIGLQILVRVAEQMERVEGTVFHRSDSQSGVEGPLQQ